MFIVDGWKIKFFMMTCLKAIFADICFSAVERFDGLLVEAFSMD